MTAAQDRVDGSGREHEKVIREMGDPVALAILGLTDVLRQYMVEQLEPNDITFTVEGDERTLYHRDEGSAFQVMYGQEEPVTQRVMPPPVPSSDIEHYCNRTRFIEPGTVVECGCGG